MSQVYESMDDEIRALRAELDALNRSFNDGSWIGDVADLSPRVRTQLQLCFERAQLRVQAVTSELDSLIEQRKLALRVALRTGTATYDTGLWRVSTRATIEYDVQRLREDYPDLPPSAIKTTQTVVKRQIPAHVRLSEYEVSRSQTYTIALATQGSDDDEGV